MKINIYRIQKQCILLCVLFFAGFQAAAQQHSVKEIKADPRLYECFPKDYVDGLNDNPRLLLYYNFFLDHSYMLTEPQGKAPQGIDIYTVTYKEKDIDGKTKYFDEDLSDFNPKKFCVLKYNFKRSPEQYTQYLLGNTGKVLIFYPSKDFTVQYNAYLKLFGFDPDKK